MMTLVSVAPATEVSVEFDPRLAGLGTVRPWEETGIAGSISRRLSSFPGLLDLCAAPLLGVSGEGSPSSPVMSAGLKLHRGNFCMVMLAFMQSLNPLRGLPCFRFPEASSANINCFGSLLSSLWMACPTQQSRLFKIMASMLVDSAMSRTCRFETQSYHLMFRMVRRLRIFRRSSCFRCLLYRVHVSQP